MNQLRDRWDRDLTPDEIVIEKENVTVFDRSIGNPVKNMLLKYISENYKGDERTYTDKSGDETVSSYRLLLVAHNSSGFDSWVVLNSLVKETTELKVTKTFAVGRLAGIYGYHPSPSNTYAPVCSF